MCFRNIFCNWVEREEADLAQEAEDGIPKHEKIMYNSAVSCVQ